MNETCPIKTPDCHDLGMLDRIARAALAHYALPARLGIHMHNISENATFRVSDLDNGRQWALRIHREGYHTLQGIRSELAWLQALRADGAALTPQPCRGRDGDYVQTVIADGMSRPRHAVLSEWEAGVEPKSGDVDAFAIMGETAARMHAHVHAWTPPAGFERHVWNYDTTLGDRPHWGRWQNGIGLTPGMLKLFGRTAERIRVRLAAFGKDRERFGLVHGDMRLANLLQDGPIFKVIDFDDCGFSWFLYDCATTVSFFEHDPHVPELIAAWVEGYRRVRALSDAEAAEIETFVMLRRLLLVAWIGSHAETGLAQSMGAPYTAATAPMCEFFLSRN